MVFLKWKRSETKSCSLCWRLCFSALTFAHMGDRRLHWISHLHNCMQSLSRFKLLMKFLSVISFDGECEWSDEWMRFSQWMMCHLESALLPDFGCAYNWRTSTAAHSFRFKWHSFREVPLFVSRLRLRTTKDSHRNCLIFSGERKHLRKQINVSSDFWKQISFHETTNKLFESQFLSLYLFRR